MTAMGERGRAGGRCVGPGRAMKPIDTRARTRIYFPFVRLSRKKGRAPPEKSNMKTNANLNGWARFAVVACALVSLARPASAAMAPATVDTTGSSVTTTILGDQSKVVKFLADGTFTVPAGATGRILLVAGGGAGGRDCSGGGGAGGMLEASNLVFSAGTYTVTVGAGGQPVNNSNVTGGNGGNTVLAFGGADLYTAVGGGGGGSWGHVSAANGGSGGGATSNGKGGSGVDGQGYAGGDAGNRAPAGGGGAGGPGSQGTNFNGPGTAGGPGRVSDITGEEVYYAGGGGGGFNSTATLLNGGIGGGGNGVRNVSVKTRQDTTLPDGRNEYAAECGVDGLGGGGGGANNGGGENDYRGRPGGSGVLIVRLDPVMSGPEPQIAVLDVTDGPESATVRARVISVGEDASSVAVSYAVATSAAALDSATPVEAASGAVDGDTVSFTISGLTAGTTYYVRLLAENNRGETCHEDTECLPYVSLVTATAAGAARVFDVGRDRVAVFTNSTATKTFTLPERAAVELLLVGGGGGGGSYVGGGGGAGGFLHVETAVLDAGTYTVSVGAGGSGATADQRQGVSGGNTTLAK